MKFKSFGFYIDNFFTEKKEILWKQNFLIGKIYLSLLLEL
jgi:hypothetical protein